MAKPVLKEFGRTQKRAYREIRVREQLADEAEKIAAESGLAVVTARVLAARGFTIGKDLLDYLEPTLQRGLLPPSDIKNLSKAVSLVAQVVASKKAIAICCDFDVDGMSSGSMLSKFFLDAGILNKVFIPDRFKDGYGLNESMVREIAEQEFGLLITVDYGTSNSAELAIANSLNVPSIVIDHHHVESVPPATVFVNPQQDGCNFANATLCAAGLVWYFIIALAKELPQAKGIDPREYLDFACLGTVCDMVPLRGVNRVIAKKGIERLTQSKRAGFVSLKEVVGIKKEVRCSHIGFGIGPRLNAAGRMVTGEVVIQLLTTNDSRKASRLAKRLDKLNKQRQAVEKGITATAIARVDALKNLPDGLLVWDKGFHTGVIGIVAQRLVENFYRPAAVCGEDDGVFKGSVRGIKGFSVVEALSALQDYLLKFGGHAGAGGFSIACDRIEDFALAFETYCAKALQTIETTPTILADTEICLNELNAKVISEFASFAPFGIGNPAPTVAISDLEIYDVTILKGEHLKVHFTDGKIKIPGLLWKTASHPCVEVGKRVRIAGKPEVNSYNGNASLQINLQAIEDIS